MKKLLFFIIPVLAIIFLSAGITLDKYSGKESVKITAPVLNPEWIKATDYKQLKGYLDEYLKTGPKNYCGELKLAVDKCVSLYYEAEKAEFAGKGPSVSEFSNAGFCWGCQCQSAALGQSCATGMAPGCGWQEWYGCHWLPNTCMAAECPTCHSSRICTVVGMLS